MRISSHLTNEIKTLDAGADGIIVPMVKNHLDIKNIINQSYFPPLGSRSFSFAKPLIMELILKITLQILIKD